MAKHAGSVVLPDLHARTAMVTGASDGVGLEIARALAAAGAEVLLPVRDRAKGERAAARIRQSVPDATLSLLDLDLARLASVHALVDMLHHEGAPIDHLVLNAGIVLLGDRERHRTEDGFELHFQTNFLGHAALTLGILPLLGAAHGRVVVQGSLAAGRGALNWDDLDAAKRYSPLRAYTASKIALGLFGCELARRGTARADLTVHLCHPGIAPDTAIAPARRARSQNGLVAGLVRRLGHTPAQAAQPALLAMATDAVPPAFFGPSRRIAGPAVRQRPPANLIDRAAGRRLWEWTRVALGDAAD